MTFAIMAWIVSAGLLVVAAAAFFRKGSVAGIAVCAILAVHLHVRPILFFSGLDVPFPDAFFSSEPYDLIATASLLAAAWTALFLVGYAALASPARALAVALPQGSGAPSKQLVTTVAIASTVVAAIGTGFLVLQHGSIAQFIFASKIGKELSGTYLVRHASVLAALLCAYAIFTFAVISNSKGRFKRIVPVDAFLFFASLICINLTINYVWGNRYNIALVAFAIGLGWHYFIRPFKMTELIGGLLAFAALLQTLKYLRIFLFSQVVGHDIGAEMVFWRSVSTSLHFNQFDAFMLAIRDVGERFDFRNGADFWNGLWAWVPRPLFPEKESFHIGAWFRRIYEPTKINGWPISVVGSWYVNFGAIGVALGALLSGMVARAIDFAYANLRNSAWQAFAGPAIGFFVLNGGVDTGFVQAIFLTIVPLSLLAILFSKGGAPKEKPVGSYAGGSRGG